MRYSAACCIHTVAFTVSRPTDGGDTEAGSIAATGTTGTGGERRVAVEVHPDDTAMRPSRTTQDPDDQIRCRFMRAALPFRV
jgi:hypothetical protein